MAKRGKYRSLGKVDLGKLVSKKAVQVPVRAPSRIVECPACHFRYLVGAASMGMRATCPSCTVSHVV